MLQSIRDHTQGWIAGTIVSILIVSFALWGIHSYFEGGANTNVVVKVNGIEITKGQFSMTYERMRRQLQTQFNSTKELSVQIEADLKKQALQSLINVEALKQASIKQDYRISIEQVDDYLEHIPDFQVNGQFSTTRFQQVLAATLLSTQDFLDMIRTSLLIDQPRLGMIFTSFALPNEILSTYALIGQERDITYALLSFDTFSKQPKIISEAQIQTFYQQHEDEFRTPEQVSIEYIPLSVSDLATKVQPHEDVLKHFYNENSSSYSEPMRWKLEGILIPISSNSPTQAEVTAIQNNAEKIYDKAKSGVGFNTLIREYTFAKKPDNKRLADWVTLNQVPNEWQSTLLGLTQTGQISSPFKTDTGMMLLKVTAFQDAKVQPYDKVKNKVKETYIHHQAEEKFAELKEKLANLTYEHPDALEATAKTLGLPLKKSELFTREKGGKDISNNAKVREIAFSNEVLNQQNNSDVIQLTPDTILVLRVNSHTPTTLLPLKAVSSQIEDRLKNEAVIQKTMQLAQEIKDKLQHGMSLSEVTNQYHLTWNKMGFIGRHASKVDSAILNTAFEMPQIENGKLSVSQVKVANGYAVIVLNAVRDGSLNNTDKQQYKLFAEQIQNSQGLLEYELYKQSQVMRAKVVIGS